MFTSLRSRLWLTYALLILVALTVVAAVLLSFLLTNPLIYRQANARINQVEKALLERQTEWSDLPPDQLARRLARLVQSSAGQETDVRVLLFDAQRKLIVDSHAGIAANLTLPPLPRLRPTGAARDENGSLWLYSIKKLKNGNWLVVTAKRPVVPLATIWSDEFIAPILQAGIVALLLSLVLALVMARWIADPLQQLVLASHQMPNANPTLPEHGPHEVQELVNAFKEMITRLQASQKSQRDFVANVSHEMKTPLTSIQGFAQAIIEGAAATPQEQQKAAEIIYAEAGRMHRMVVDLLDLARLDAGTANLKTEAVDLNILLHNLADRFDLQARQAEVRLQLQVGPLPIISGDGDRLAQVFTNLVDNAIQHTPAGGQIVVSASAQPDAVNVIVQDSGAGIPTEALPHIFDRFFRGDPARQGGKDHGAGLGLAIAREIVLAHRGSIIVHSQPGQGSTFNVHLPLAQPDVSTVARRKKAVSTQFIAKS